MNSRSEEAARWFAASRRGLMLHDERQAYDTWRAVPENRAALAELQAIWDALEPVAAAESDAARAHQATGHGRQLAAVVGFMALVVAVLPRLDNGWLNALDWWSR
jgi:ferric-dicitrate binding protein FerR (iron transport regulator)